MFRKAAHWLARAFASLFACALLFAFAIVPAGGSHSAGFVSTMGTLAGVFAAALVIHGIGHAVAAFAQSAHVLLIGAILVETCAGN